MDTLISISFEGKQIDFLKLELMKDRVIECYLIEKENDYWVRFYLYLFLNFRLIVWFLRASLMAQWERIHLSMQETWV